MIESIEFKNFKVLKDTTLHLSPFTLIIGPNGSGKSTAMQALKAVLHPDNFYFSQLATKTSLPDDGAFVSIRINWLKPYKGSITTTSWNRGGSLGPQHDFSEKGLLGAEKNTIKFLLNKIRIFSFEAKAIAAPTKLQPYMELGEDGSHLAGVLDDIKDQDEERFEALNEELGRLLPEFDRILFEKPSEGTKSFLLRTREGHHKIRANALSEGTLLALALLTLAYLPDPPAIICLEEPDRGIHPRLLRDISDALNRLAYPESVGEKRQPVQVIATTHSPYFLDLYKDFPEQIVIANKIGQEVKFERLSDRPHYEEIIQDASLGDAWYTGIFGGVPAHP